MVLQDLTNLSFYKGEFHTDSQIPEKKKKKQIQILRETALLYHLSMVETTNVDQILINKFQREDRDFSNIVRLIKSLKKISQKPNINEF